MKEGNSVGKWTQFSHMQQASTCYPFEVHRDKNKLNESENFLDQKKKKKKESCVLASLITATSVNNCT